MTLDKNKSLPKIKQSLGIVFSFFLAAIFLYIAFRGVRARDVIADISKASWLWVALLALSLTFSHFLRALRWKVILKSVKPDTSIVNLFGSLMIGYGVNNIIPRLGELSRPILLGKWEGISRTSLIGTVIVERVIDSAALAVAVLISVFIYNGNLYSSFPWLKPAMYLVAIFMAAIIIFLLLLIKYREKFYNIIISFVGLFSEKIAHKLSYIFKMLIEGFSTLKDYKSYIYTFFFTALITISYAVNSYIGFFTLGMQFIMPISFSLAWVLYCISSFGVVIPTPGGTGSYQVITKTAVVMLFGFSSQLSLAYATITWFVSYLLSILLALIFFFWLNHRYIKKTGKAEKLVDILETKVDSL